MTEIECPNCKATVDIDSPLVVKEPAGLDLKVVCPKCGTQFVVTRIAHVRQQILKAEAAFARTRQGKARMKL